MKKKLCFIFLFFGFLGSCEKMSLAEEALIFAKGCDSRFDIPVDDILLVEKVTEEKVLLRLVRNIPDAPLYGVVDRYQLTDPKIQNTKLTCGFENLAFNDSTFAIASGYWMKRRIYGGIDGNPPYSFFLTNLKIIEN